MVLPRIIDAIPVLRKWFSHESSTIYRCYGSGSPTNHRRYTGVREVVLLRIMRRTSVVRLCDRRWIVSDLTIISLVFHRCTNGGHRCSNGVLHRWRGDLSAVHRLIWTCDLTVNRPCRNWWIIGNSSVVLWWFHRCNIVGHFISFEWSIEKGCLSPLIYRWAIDGFIWSAPDSLSVIHH